MGVEYINGIHFKHRISKIIPIGQCYVRVKDGIFYVISPEVMHTVDCIAAINNYLKLKDAETYKE